MDPDQLQQTWKAQAGETPLVIHSDMVLNEVRREHRRCESIVFWRDVREVGVGIGLAAGLLLWGIANDLWPLFVMALSAIWVAGFIVFDRIRQRRKAPPFGGSLLECVESSLALVNHQVWLLRNVFWWYLLPPTAAIVLLHWYCTPVVRDFSLPSLLLVIPPLASLAVCAVVIWGVYWMNQRAGRRELEPRRQELEALRDALKACEE